MFGFRKVKGLPTEAELTQRMNTLEAAMRTLEREQLDMHDQVQRWMRRAVAAERAAGRHQEPVGAAPTATPAPPARLSPARLRAMAQGRVWGGGVEAPAAPANGTTED